MVYVDKRLLALAKNKYKLLEEDGVPVKCKYLGYEMVTNEKYNSETCKFKFKTTEGEMKSINTKQKGFLRKFASIEVGSVLEIVGYNLETTKEREYEVTVISRPKMAGKVKEQEEVEEEVEEVEEEQEEELEEDKVEDGEEEVAEADF